MRKYYFTNSTGNRQRNRDVQLRIEKETGLYLRNPFYNHAGTPSDEIKILDRGEIPDTTNNEIVDCDLKLIDEADGVVAYIDDRTSWGSIHECFYCSRVARKPTYIIFDPNSRNGINNPKHPWATRNATRTFGTIEGFIEFAKEKLQEKENGKV